MGLLIVRLSRMVPLLIVMAALAAIIYFVVSYRHSPTRAKEVLIRVFLWLNGIITGLFGLSALYAMFEKNDAVFELAICFAAVGVSGLLVRLWCRYVFLKHHPQYRNKPMKATTKRRWPWGK